LRLFLKTFNLVPGVPGFWARGGEGALAETPRATRSRPNFGSIKNFIFLPTCGSRKSAKNEGNLATRLQLSCFGSTRGCRKWEKVKNLHRLAAAASWRNYGKRVKKTKRGTRKSKKKGNEND